MRIIPLAAVILVSTLAVGCGDTDRTGPPDYRSPFTEREPSAELAAEGARLFESKKCTFCHKTTGSSSRAGPNLEGVGSRLTAAELDVWIRYPARKKPNTQMPPFDGADRELEAIIAFLLET